MYEDNIRSLRPFIFIGLVVIAFISVLYIFFNYAFITINVESMSDEKKTYTAATSGGEVFRVETENTTVRKLVKRDHLVITVEQDTMRTFTETETGLLNSTEVKLTLSPQKSSEKIATESEGCQLKSGNTVLSYNCLGGEAVYNHKYNNTGGYKENVNIAPGGSPGRIFTYGSDLVFTNIEDGRIVLNSYDTRDGKLSELLSNDKYSLSFNSTVVTDDINDTMLVYVNNDTSEAHILKDGVFQYTISLKEGIEDLPYTTSLFSLHGNTLLYYYGLDDSPSDSELETEAQESIEKGYLKTYNLETKENQLIKTSSDFTPSSIDLLSSDRFVIFRDAIGVQLYSIEGNSLESGEIFNQVNRPQVITKNGFYFVGPSDGIYLFNTNTNNAELIYHELNVRLSSVNQFNKELFFSGFTQDTGSLEVLNGYRLIAKKNAQYPRIESVLPYSRAEVPIRSMDYNKSTLYVYLLITSFSFDRSTNQPFIDQQEFETKKNQFLTRLRQDGFDPKNFDIKFYY